MARSVAVHAGGTMGWRGGVMLMAMAMIEAASAPREGEVPTGAIAVMEATRVEA